MKCVRLQNAGPGPLDERVELEQILDNDTSKSSVAVMPASEVNPIARLTLFIDTAAAKGQFKQDQAYIMTFAETT